MVPGWLFPYLVPLDERYGSHRWSYWGRALDLWELPPEPIPPIHFLEQPERSVVKHLVGILDYAERYAGLWHTEAFEAWVAWVLHGLGDPEFRQHETAATLPDLRQLTPRVLDYWYETFNLGLLLQHPADYLAHLAQGGENKGHNPYAGAGFFATPMSVCTMMAAMTFAGTDAAATKTASLCDPCCGTGSLLLAASNYCMNLYGNDISLTMVRCTRLNGWLYIPWAVFWPDFSIFGGPTPQQLREILFEGARVPGMTPDPAVIPPAPLPVNIIQGELKQTAHGQYILPLFEEMILAL
jgi:hypothetical protein